MLHAALNFCILSASFLQHLLLSSHSNSKLYFLLQLLYLETSNLLLCPTPSLSKLYLKAVANTVLGRRFPSGISICLSEKKSCSATFRIHLFINILQCWLFFFHGSSNFPMPPYVTILNQTKLFWLVSDKNSGSRFFSCLCCFGFLSVCWKLETVVLRDSPF